MLPVGIFLTRECKLCWLWRNQGCKFNSSTQMLERSAMPKNLPCGEQRISLDPSGSSGACSFQELMAAGRKLGGGGAISSNVLQEVVSDIC